MRRYIKCVKINRRKFIFILSIIGLFIVYCVLDINLEFVSNFPFAIFTTEYYIVDGYLVYNSKCQIPSLNLTNVAISKFVKKMEFEPCKSTPLLSSIVEETNGRHYLVINPSVAETYDKFICCWSSITRPNPTKFSLKDCDSKINVDDCVDFDNKVLLPLDLEVVMVSCRKNKQTKKIIYENIHAIINSIKIQRGKNKFTTLINNKFNYDRTKMSVLILGMDSVSRMNFLRSLPNTDEYLRKTGWFNLKGYNKIGLNTFPNLMPLLTGQNMTTINAKCHVDESYGLDNCPFIWHNFKNAGYVTAHGEDDTLHNTFNYFSVGFVNSPTDYYIRPYILATEKLLKSKKNFNTEKYCTGPESSIDRIFNYAANFSKKFLNIPYFGFFWTNAISHNCMNGISSMDTYFINYFSQLEHQGTFNNTIVIFLSDHGVRWGKFRETFVGGHEDRLPFIYLRIPEEHEEYNKITQALKINENRLTSPYDLHETLRDVLIRSGGNIDSSSGCHRCQSLFDIMPMERSCEDAGISSQWCTCTTTEMIDQNDMNIGEKGVKIFLDYVDSVIEKFKNKNDKRLCSQLQLKKIHQINEIIDMNNNNTKIINKKYSYRIEVAPGGAMFEFIIYTNENGDFTMHDDEIIRINSYDKDSKCLENKFKKFCYCLIHMEDIK